jgi:hypothetical protein
MTSNLLGDIKIDCEHVFFSSYELMRSVSCAFILLKILNHSYMWQPVHLPEMLELVMWLGATPLLLYQ